MSEPISIPSSSRRQFLQASSAAMAAQLTMSSGAFAAGSDEIKVGLIGCGGRGTGAAVQALKADPGARLVAMPRIRERADEWRLPSASIEELVQVLAEIDAARFGGARGGVAEARERMLALARALAEGGR